jgi:hypothetical protein
MLYIKGGGTKEHVEFDTAVPQCQFKGRDFGECDGDIVKMKVCGFHVGRILAFFVLLAMERKYSFPENRLDQRISKSLFANII